MNMTDLLFDPPPAPKPEPKKGITINPKYAMAFFIAAFAVLITVLLVPGNSTPTTTTVATTQAPVITAAPVNKYDQYLEHVYNNSGQANSMSRAKLIEYGDTICGALDQGKTIGWIVSYLANGSNTQSDLELYASIVSGAVKYICSEYIGDLDLFLNQ